MFASKCIVCRSTAASNKDRANEGNHKGIAGLFLSCGNSMDDTAGIRVSFIVVQVACYSIISISAYVCCITVVHKSTVQSLFVDLSNWCQRLLSIVVCRKLSYTMSRFHRVVPCFFSAVPVVSIRIEVLIL